MLSEITLLAISPYFTMCSCGNNVLLSHGMWKTK